MSFLTALALLAGLVSGGISLYEFAKDNKRRGTISAIFAVGIILGAFFLSSQPLSSTSSW